MIGIGISTSSARTSRAVNTNPLAAFYGVGPGKITIHLRTTEATLNSSNQATALKNIGGAGTMFNATVSGTPLTVNADKTVALSAASGTPILANLASIMNVRFMWLCSTDSLVSSTKFFGTTGYELRLGSMQPDFSNFIQYWANVSGTGVTANPTPRAKFPTTGLHLMEVETTPNSTAFFIDGVSQSTSTSFPWADFLIDRIGQGNSAGTPFTGNMGDIIGVTLGTGSAVTINAARSYMTGRFGLETSYQNNLLRYSEDFTQAAWSKIGTTITPAAVTSEINGFVSDADNLAYSLYDVTNSTWILQKTNYGITNGRFNTVITIPANCTTLRIYPTRKDTSMYTYQQVTVVPTAAYNYSCYINGNNIGGVMLSSGSQLKDYQKRL